MVFISRATHVLHWRRQKKAKKRFLAIFKNRHSPDYGLKLDRKKMKSLVIVDYKATVNDKSNPAHTAHHIRKVEHTVLCGKNPTRL